MVLAAGFLMLGGCSLFDAGSPGGPDDPVEPGSPITFQLSYQPDVPDPNNVIFVQNACTQLWLSVIDEAGQRIQIDSDCGVCRCDACGPCAVCACAFSEDPVLPGDTLEHRWDGLIHPTASTPQCGFCETDDVLEPGTYTAQFCFVRSADGAIECADERFTYPTATGVVSHVVTSP